MPAVVERLGRTAEACHLLNTIAPADDRLPIQLRVAHAVAVLAADAKRVAATATAAVYYVPLGGPLDHQPLVQPGGIGGVAPQLVHQRSAQLGDVAHQVGSEGASAHADSA